MKYLILALSFLTSAVSFAMPTVGDYASLAVTFNGAAVGTVEEELIDFNAGSNQFLQKTTQTFSGQVNVSQKWTNGVTDAQITQIMGGCAGLGGALQIVTEPAGSFSTCAMPVNSNGSVGTMWIGAVPFGIVKADIVNNGNHIGEDLVSIKK